MVLGEEESVLFSEVSLFQYTNMVLGEKEVSCLERCPYFRGVLIEGFHCMYIPLHRILSSCLCRHQ